MTTSAGAGDYAVGIQSCLYGMNAKNNLDGNIMASGKHYVIHIRSL